MAADLLLLSNLLSLSLWLCAVCAVPAAVLRHPICLQYLRKYLKTEYNEEYALV